MIMSQCIDYLLVSSRNLILQTRDVRLYPSFAIVISVALWLITLTDDTEVTLTVMMTTSSHTVILRPRPHVSLFV